MTTEEKIRYATWLGRVGLLRQGHTRQTCIASGAITTHALRALGIDARPITASVLAATDGWVKRIDKTGPPSSPEELVEWWETDKAYSVSVMYDSNPDPGAWTAHLIVLAGPGHSYLCDPSADQLSRPQFDLPIQPVVFDMGAQSTFDQHEFRRGRVQAVSHWSDEKNPDAQGFILAHSIFPADRSFRKLPDFRMFEWRYGDLTRSVVEAIKDMDEKGLTGDALPELPELPDAPDNPAMVAKPRPIERGRLRMTVDG